MSDYFNVTTNIGDAAISTAIANNSKLNITHIAFGDGNGSVPTPTKTRTSLVREVHRQAITKYAMHPTIANYIVIETIIPSNIGGFWIREMGIIADNVLISHGSHAPFFKVADPDGVSEYRLKFTQNIRDGNVVEISLDESLIYASQAWVNENYIRRNELVDNLTTDDAKKPVSSKQAKNLQDNKLDKTANAVSSSKLETVRTVSFSGAATGSFSYDGSSNSSAILTLANSGVTANTYGASLKIPIITVNAKGLITGVSEQNIPIVDNLTTDDASKPLSAAQGKILNDQKLNKDENAVGIKPINNRILKPSEISLGVQAYFATLNSDNSAFFCDFLSLNGWSDASGGLKNALVLSKTGQSLHHYQAEYASQTWTIKKQIAYIDDNVASASKLKTPRNIFGQTFDGSSDVGGTVTASTGLFQADSFHYIDMGRNGLDRMSFYNYGATFNFIDSANGNVVARITQNGIDCNAASATDCSRSVIAGNGLSGGGVLTANRTLTLGTPTKITSSSTNSVTTTSHTHEIDNASTSVAGVVQLNNTLTSTSTTQALTAAQGKVLLEMFASSHTQNGYQKIANPLDPSKPLIIQWGKPGIINSGTTINFPIAFPNQVFIVIASDYQGNAVIGTSNWTLTNFQSRSASIIAYNWFAVGF